MSTHCCVVFGLQLRNSKNKVFVHAYFTKMCPVVFVDPILFKMRNVRQKNHSSFAFSRRIPEAQPHIHNYRQLISYSPKNCRNSFSLSFMIYMLRFSRYKHKMYSDQKCYDKEIGNEEVFQVANVGCHRRSPSLFSVSETSHERRCFVERLRGVLARAIARE